MKSNHRYDTVGHNNYNDYYVLFCLYNRQLLILMVVVLMDLLVQVLLHLWSLLQLLWLFKQSKNFELN